MEQRKELMPTRNELPSYMWIPYWEPETDEYESMDWGSTGLNYDPDEELPFN